jgi:hypothetical protein
MALLFQEGSNPGNKSKSVFFFVKIRIVVNPSMKRETEKPRTTNVMPIDTNILLFFQK